jgi:hypothetical protein
MNELLQENGPALDWEKLRPVLDTAMHELDELDREAILMRYFENRKHADIGQFLGLTENAARMKVDRALEKLRTALSKHGVTTAATLATTLSTNAVQVAPAGLAATITAGTLSAVSVGVAGTTTTATATAVKAAALTTLQKTVVGGIMAVAVGAGIYEAQRASSLEKRIQSLRQEQEPLVRQVSDLTAENDRLSNLVASGYNGDQALSRSNLDRQIKSRLAAGMSELEIQLREAMKLPDGERQKRLEEIARSIAIADIPAAITLGESALSLEPERRFFQAG